MRYTIIFIFIGMTGITQSVAASAPSFDLFPADTHIASNVPAIDWSSNPDAKRFRTALSNAFTKGARFAGHYAVATWGCGSDCQMIAIVDMQNGHVTFGPTAEFDYEFRLGSRLLIVNSPSAIEESIWNSGGCPDREDSWAATSHYYEWTGRQFRHIVDIIECNNLPRSPAISPDG